MSALQQFRAIRQSHEEKKEKTEQQKFDEIPKGAVMALLCKNTKERNSARCTITMLECQLTKKRNEHIDLLDRLKNYESGVEKEFFTFLEKENMMVRCKDSSRIGVYSKKDIYTPKGHCTGKMAHFTINYHFLKYCEKDDEEPISYDGWFIYKNYKEKLYNLMKCKLNKSYKALINGDF